MKKGILTVVILICLIFSSPLYAKGTEEGSSDADMSNAAGPPAGQDPAKWSGKGEMPPELVKGEGGYSHGTPSYGGTFRWFYNVEPPSAYEGDANFASLRFLETWKWSCAISALYLHWQLFFFLNLYRYQTGYF